MVLDYYPLIDNEGNVTEFAEVEALDDVKTKVLYIKNRHHFDLRKSGDVYTK